MPYKMAPWPTSVIMQLASATIPGERSMPIISFSLPRAEPRIGISSPKGLNYTEEHHSSASLTDPCQV